MDTDKQQVLIVGAGAAGLAAAHDLRDLKPLVLEAEEFIGGRTRSETWPDGTWLNLGAQFHESNSDWAEELGVTVHSGPPPPPAVYWRGKMVVEKNRFVYFLKLPLSLQAKLSLIRAYFRMLPALRRYPDIDPKLRGKSLRELLGSIHPEAVRFFNLWAPSAGARDISELPAERGLSTLQLAFGNLARRGVRLGIVEGGTSALFAPVVRELGERLVSQARVVRLEPTKDGVQVTYLKDGREVTISAAACICTVPTAALLRIIPTLSSQRREVFQEITFVPLVTIALQLDSALSGTWDDFYWLKVDGTYISNVLNYAYFLPTERRPRGKSLSILATGDPADRLLAKSDHDAQMSVRNEFCEIFPRARGRILASRIARWPQGLHQVSFRLQEQIQRLYEPEEGIYLAGEYLEGGGVSNAIRSGRRTASAVREHLRY